MLYPLQSKMLILLIIFAWASSARIDPPPDIQFTSPMEINPHSRSGGNFDPRFNITCLGPHSDIPWNYHRYDGRSMQKLCAQPQYGGQRDPGLNLGGYCQGQDVAFQYGAWSVPASHVNSLRYIRPFLECRSRCFCNHGLQTPYEQPKSVPTTRKTFSGPLPNEGHASAIAVDRKSPASWARPEHLTRVLMNTPAPYQGNDVGILPSNMIRCGGPLPAFDLPGPWNVGEFPNNQLLCAVQLSGGSAAANAGAYCHRDGTAGKLVAFADDMTPRWDWTWSSSGTFLNTASLRFHCWKNCLCAQPSKKPNYNDPLIPMWDFMLKRLPESGFSVTKGNRNPLGSSTDAKGKIKNSASEGNLPATQCATGSGDSGTCSIPWRTDIMGPIPDSVAKLSPPKPLSPDWNPNKQCGNRCDSNSDCGSDCLCKVPSTEEAHSLGLAPSPAIAFCITFASVFGRSLDQTLGQVECLCNATYISTACCHSRDGRVQIG